MPWTRFGIRSFLNGIDVVVLVVSLIASYTLTRYISLQDLELLVRTMVSLSASLFAVQLAMFAIFSAAIHPSVLAKMVEQGEEGERASLLYRMMVPHLAGSLGWLAGLILLLLALVSTMVWVRAAITVWLFALGVSAFSYSLAAIPQLMVQCSSFIDIQAQFLAKNKDKED